MLFWILSNDFAFHSIVISLYSKGNFSLRLLVHWNAPSFLTYQLYHMFPAFFKTWSCANCAYLFCTQGRNSPFWRRGYWHTGILCGIMVMLWGAQRPFLSEGAAVLRNFTRFGKSNNIKELYFCNSSFCVYSALHLPKFCALFRSLRKAVLLFADTDPFDYKLLLGVRRECYFVCGNV